MRMRVFLLLFVWAAVEVSAGASKSEKNRPPMEFKAGVTTRVFHPKVKRNWRGAEHQELRVTVWYPAAENAVEVQQVIGPPDGPLLLAGKAAEHARKDHGMTEIPPEVLTKVKAAVRDEA